MSSAIFDPGYNSHLRVTGRHSPVHPNSVPYLVGARTLALDSHLRLSPSGSILLLEQGWSRSTFARDSS
jgi:hypothetical protein